MTFQVHVRIGLAPDVEDDVAVQGEGRLVAAKAERQVAIDADDSSTEASPVNSLSSQPVGVPLAGRSAGVLSVTGTRTRPVASAVGG